jgi:Na+-transporting methylmalonyl-CoA/oxaloacetate decarboxylase gamma subunit
VTLSLPTTLGDLIKKEAAKLGLTKAAKKTSAYAQLSGDGYEVTPNGRQTAAVTPGEPTTFAWQVKPGPEAKGQLKSEFGVELNGAKPPQEFALGTITKRVAAVPEAVKKGVSGLDFGSLNKTIALPGLGQTSLKTVLGAALVLLAVIILAVVSRNASESRRRAERQRKFRARNDFGHSEADAEPVHEAERAPAEHVQEREHHVNPFVAAAGGALVGAAATAAFNHHREEQQAAAEEHHSPFGVQNDHPVAPPQPEAPVEAHPEPHVAAAPEAHVEAPVEYAPAPVEHVAAAPEPHVEAPVEHAPFAHATTEVAHTPHVAAPPVAEPQGHGHEKAKEHEPA